MAVTIPEKYIFNLSVTLGMGLLIALTAASEGLPVFWDAIMTGSKAAHHFYENGLGNFILPEKIDAGHPPLFGIYLAWIWKTFGKSLPNSHWAMFPFQVLALGSLWFILKKAKPSHFLLLAGVWVIITEPGFLALLTQIAYDVPLLAFFLASLAAITYRKSTLTTLALLPLSLLSSRGFLLLLVLAMVQLYLNRKELPHFQPIKIIKTLGPFSLAGLLWVSWQFWHWHNTGWMAYNPQSQWAANYEKAKGLEIIRNAFLIFWRCMDFGRFGFWSVLVFLLYKNRNRIKELPDISKLLFLTGSLAIVIPSLLLLWYHNPISHRYYQAAYLCFLCGTLIYLDKETLLFRISSYSLIITCQVLGAFIPYPDKIARGWDATPIWVFYPKVSEQAELFIQNQALNRASFGSEFPNLDSKKFTYLTEDSENDTLSIINLKTQEYFYYSNVFNDVADSTIDILKTYPILFQKQEAGVKIMLLKKPK